MVELSTLRPLALVRRWGVLFALLALSLIVPPEAGADWTVRPVPTGPSGADRCVLESERQPVFDGYQNTWVQIAVDDKAVRVTSASTLDGGDRDIGLVIDEGILVSRSFYEVVSHISQENARLCQYAGLYRDKHIREHEVYEVQVVPGPAPLPAADIGGTGSGEAAAPVEGGEPVAFSPELLARVTRALVDDVGPVANLIVRRASLRARDPRQLVAAVADSLSGAARQKFLADVGDVASRAASPAAAKGGVTPATPPRGPERRSAPGPITPKVLIAAEERLARHLGPIARVLVAQAAKEATDTGQLAERLAAHIADPAARRVFLAAMDEGAS